MVRSEDKFSATFPIFKNRFLKSPLTLTYKATLGTRARVITAIITVVFVSLIVFFFWRISLSHGGADTSVYILSILALLTIYTFCFLYQPLFYVVDQDHLIVKRRIRDIAISIKDIKAACIVRKESMGWTEKEGGNDGLFGFYG